MDRLKIKNLVIILETITLILIILFACIFCLFCSLNLDENIEVGCFLEVLVDYNYTMIQQHKEDELYKMYEELKNNSRSWGSYEYPYENIIDEFYQYMLRPEIQSYSFPN